MNTVKRLKIAKSLIENPNNWTQSSSVAAAGTKLCIMTALGRTLCPSDYEIKRNREFQLARHFLAEAMIPDRDTRPIYIALTVYNDDPTTTHEDVMALYDRAIALAEEAT